METITTDSGNIVKIFANTVEFKAYDQIKALANFEAYQKSKIRIMPDCHAGSGCTIGTTMTIDGIITPNLVGVDIGCGMLTIKLREREIDLSKLDEVINSKIPSGFNIHAAPQAKFDFDKLRCKKHLDLVRAAKSIGSLGGGNHFIELGKNDKDELFLVIHSGSRNIGNQLAKYYQSIAWENVNQMKTVKKNLIKELKKAGRKKDIDTEIKSLKKPVANKELAFLENDFFDAYMHDMQIIQKYAVLNRKTMADIILKNMELNTDYSFETIHNYIDFKRMILRKGAVSAEMGERLLIPINMRDGSLICVGKGNADWNYSAPHGAGRLMSRTKARKNIDLKNFKKQMKGIYSTSVSVATLDEAPDAYKSMKEIVGQIGDTVDIVDVVRPIYNFKAH